MKFQIGDRVLVKHTNEEAEVVEIIDPKMVMLEIRDVRFPAYIDQLEFPYFKRFSEQKVVVPKKEKKFIDAIPVERKRSSERTADGIWLTLIPMLHSDEFGDDVIDDLKVHLINRTHSPMHFQYAVNFSGSEGFAHQNVIQPFEDFYLHDIPFEQINDSPLISCEFSLVKGDKSKAPYFEHFIKLKPKQVFKQIMDLRARGEAMYSILIAVQYPDKSVEETVSDAPVISKGAAGPVNVLDIRRHLEPPRPVLDLHIEVLDTNHERLSSVQKLTLQLQTFEKYLDLALIHHQHHMIVIHGVGSGKLRDEIHEILRRQSHVSGFVNRYHPAYGYGATEITFK